MDENVIKRISYMYSHRFAADPTAIIQILSSLGLITPSGCVRLPEVTPVEFQENSVTL